MAVRYAVATGNWSALATWDGGASLPGAGDTVHANGYTVTIDQNINVGSLRTTSGSGIAAGGGFTVSTGGYTITLTESSSSVLWPGTTTVLTVSHATGTTTLVSSGAEAYHNGSTNSTFCVLLSGAGGTLTMTCGLRGGASNRPSVYVSGSGATLNITGSVACGGGSTQGGLYVAVAATVSIVGDVLQSNNTVIHVNVAASVTLSITGVVYGQTINSSAPTISWTTATGTITITGTLNGGSASGNHGLSLGSAAPTVNVVGNVVSGSGGNGISSTGSVTINVTGDVTSGGTDGISCSGSATIVVTGTVTSATSGGVVGILSTGTGSSVRVSGNLVGASSGESALCCRKIVGNWSIPSYWRFAKHGGGTVDLVTTDSLAGLPDEADVRDGTLYGASDEFEGTLIVPDPQYVLAGVLTDDTVGTAVASADPAAIAAAVWDYLTADADTTGSMGLRLRTTATVDSTGAQLAAFGA